MIPNRLIDLFCIALIVTATACDNRSDSSRIDSASAKPPGASVKDEQKPAPTPTPAKKVEKPTNTGAPETAKDDPTPRVGLEIALGTESWGKIVLQLDAVKAPITVKNFLRYVDQGYYNGTIFHRVMPNFMIQGGGYVSGFKRKTEGQHEPIKNEAKNGLKNKRGTVAMARTPAPHSATSEFFINVVDNTGLDYPSRDGWGYCVFGKVVQGMDVVDRIKNIETRRDQRGEISQPINPPVLKKAYRIKAN
ncbi:MAG: peptidylprolyl isomerase [Planctomycetota bacterium]|nr:MAG: peptidylprolyl isomerase [Planctomycetota bacterium]